jgi:hypothetical protein
MSLAHLIAIDTGEFSTSRGLDKGGIGAGTSPLDCERHSELDLGAKPE